MDLATITAGLGSIKSAMDIAKALKDTDLSLEKAETKLQLAELVSTLADAKMQIVEIQEALIESDKEKKELENKLSQKENLFFKRPYYLIKQDDNDNDGPFCQTCYDKDNKLIRLNDEPFISGQWDCPVCKQDFKDENYNYEEAKKRAEDTLQAVRSAFP
ncbi:MAG: hypothetical protein U9R16_00450 [Campylobacterota bacterium]|nr:hypothetical protein [Campylobacterota bacterium]